MTPATSAQRSRLRCANGMEERGLEAPGAVVGAGNASRSPGRPTPRRTRRRSRPTDHRIAGRGHERARVGRRPRPTSLGVSTSRTRPPAAVGSRRRPRTGPPTRSRSRSTTRPAGPPTPYDPLHGVAARHPQRRSRPPGVPSTSDWRTAGSCSGTCQRSSAPIHQSSCQPAAIGRDRSVRVDQRLMRASRARRRASGRARLLRSCDAVQLGLWPLAA